MESDHSNANSVMDLGEFEWKRDSGRKAEADISGLGRQTKGINGAENKIGAENMQQPRNMENPIVRMDLETRFDEMDKKLSRIILAVDTLKSDKMNNCDDEDDRKRLKEKLKLAIEVDRRSRIHTIVSRREVWMEYIFGICSPDKRIGKRGSR